VCSRTGGREEEGGTEDWLLQADLVQSLRVRMDALFVSLGLGEEVMAEMGVTGHAESIESLAGVDSSSVGSKPLCGAYALYYDLPCAAASHPFAVGFPPTGPVGQGWEQQRRAAMRELPALRARAPHAALSDLLRGLGSAARWRDGQEW